MVNKKTGKKTSKKKGRK